MSHGTKKRTLKGQMNVTKMRVEERTGGRGEMPRIYALPVALSPPNAFDHSAFVASIARKAVSGNRAA